MLSLSIEDLERRIANISVQMEEMVNNVRLLNGSKLTMEGLLAEAKKAKEQADAQVVAAEATEAVEAPPQPETV